MIDQATIARIMDTARIEEVVSDYVTLRKRGVNLIGLCPFHDEKTGSFTVSPAKGIFKCFGCGKGGNAVHFVMEHEQISYVEALKVLAKKYNIEVQERELSPEELAAQNDRESMFLVNNFAQKWFSDNLWNTPTGQTIGGGYFRERGFREDIIRKFQLGYSPNDREALPKAAIAASYKAEFLEKTGLCYKLDNGMLADRFRGRVIFPVHTLSGKVVAFGGRVLKQNDNTAKYVNSPESEIYHKSNELYGIYFAKQAIVKHDTCFLVEGYTDVISMHQAGIENVVASSGTALTPGQIRLIHRFTNNITVLYDGDAAGIKASIRGIDMLLEEGLNVKVLLLPDGEDPDSFARKNNASDFIAYVQQNQTDFIRFKTRLLLEDAGQDPIKRAALIQDILNSIAVIPDQIVRQVYVKDCSTLFEIDKIVLLNAINKIRWNKSNQPIKSNTAPQKAEMPKNQAIDVAVNTILDNEIRNVLQIIIRYGERPLYTTENNQLISVGDYIIEELERDNIVFDNILYNNILSEYKAHRNDENFMAENFFKFHTNSEICRLAIDLITEKYAISRIHFKQNISENVKKEVKIPTDADRLGQLVPHLLLELKSSLLKDRIKKVLQELKAASEENDRARVNALMTTYDNLNNILKLLNKNLERVL